MSKVEKMAKKYGILYSVLPDMNKTDGMRAVIFHSEAVPRANMMIQKLEFGRIATFDDYLKSGDENTLGKMMDFLKKQQGNEKVHTEEGDKINATIDGLIEKVVLFQGTITVLAKLMLPVMTQPALSNLSLVGSILIFCVGINLTFEKQIKVANLLPSIIFAVLCAFLPGLLRLKDTLNSYK